MIPVQTTEVQCYSTGDMWACMVADLAAATGGELNFGLVVGGMLMLAMYIAGDGEIATPAVLMLLLGGILTPILPGGVRQVATGLMLMAVVGGAFVVARRYVLQVGT
jgi:hypothetical protein